jgi:putative phosphoesterase
MKIAVLSDIHSNKFAMAAVLEAVILERPDLVILLGDTFGYYPWAVETFRLVSELRVFALLGNHDKLVLDATPPSPVPSYWQVAKQNQGALELNAPEALTWLSGLTSIAEIAVSGQNILCCHGTPADPVNGRYYPDNVGAQDWQPGRNQIVLLGHTHYPLIRVTDTGGLIANPGSVGQPRDGDLRASWGILFPSELRFELKRTKYDVLQAIEVLEEQSWYQIAIDGLRKGRIVC